MSVKRIKEQELLDHDIRRKIMELLKKEPLSIPKLVERIYGKEKSKENRHRLKSCLSYHVMKLKKNGFVKIAYEIETPNSKKNVGKTKMYEVFYQAVK
jgi:DNA-binding transcriptional ArsR family regulator